MIRVDDVLELGAALELVVGVGRLRLVVGVRQRNELVLRQHTVFLVRVCSRANVHRT